MISTTRFLRKALSACVVLSVTLWSVTPLAAQPDDDRDQVDRAITSALEYLAVEQQPSGAWRAPALGESTAMTSLAVMAYMAAGHVPGEGPYSVRMEKGIRWVLSKQEQSGLFGDQGTHGPLYSHGITTLMLSEVLGMTPVEDSRPVRNALEKAVALILKAQNVRKPERDTGGWRYHATSQDSDLSVTGWQLLALRAAKNVGCDVPAENIDAAVGYVKRCSVEGRKGFAYQPPAGATAVRTGTGILALEICGEHLSPEAVGGADFLLSHPLRYEDGYFFYGAYYCSVGMFQIGGKHWEATRERMIELLLPHQREDGSWDPSNGGEQAAGRIYATSMAVLSLAVEYQYLPIYQR